MTQNLKKLRKYILTDPIKAFTDQDSRDSKHQLDALNDLWTQYRLLKKQHKATQTQAGLISRKIGESKHNGNPLDPLKQQMRECSIQSKHQLAQVHAIEEQILALFDIEQQRQDISKEPSSSKPADRIYSKPPLIDLSEISICLLKSEHAAWNNYVATNPAATLYHHTEWRELIQKTFGHKGLYLFAKNNNGELVGILPLVHLKSILFGDFMVSMPYFNYGGAVADHPLIEQKLINSANEYATGLGVSHIEYRDDIKRTGYPCRTDKVNMILALPKDQNTLWKNFTPKLRAQIKRPQRENPEIVFGGKELLNDFYTVFARNMRDLGTPVYSRLFFENILKSFSQQSKIMVLRLNNRPVAAAFLIGDKGTLEIPWASTVKTVNHLSMNMLLYWEILKFSIQNDFKYFDFGRSSKDSGTFRFKQQWGAMPKPLYWHYWLRDKNNMPLMNPTNPKYALMIRIWKRLPITLTKWIGPPIVKNLP